MIRVAGLLATLSVVSALSANAQSLAAVAKAEEARRKNVDGTAKVYTNNDLRSDFTSPTAAPPPAATAPSAATQASAAAPADPNAAASTTAAAEPASPKKDQAYWKNRMDAAKETVERSKMFLDALQSRINALTTQVINRDDPYQQATLEKDRQKNLAEFDRVKKEIDSGLKAVTALEEEARKAGVPPGWLR